MNAIVRKKIRKKARRLVLDRSHMIAMLSDPGFYTACPHFLWLRTTAMQTYAVYESTPVSCTACAGDFNIMRQVVDAFFSNLTQLSKEGVDDAAASIKRYLETKKGYQIREVVIYYRADKKQPHPARFAF